MARTRSLAARSAGPGPELNPSAAPAGSLRDVAYDEELAHRTRELLADQDGVTEKRMFGGLAFLLNGNMSVAVSSQGGLLVHVAPERSGEMISKPHASLMQMGNRPPMKGWIRVAPEGLRTKRELAAWVSVGTAYAGALPPKS